MIARAPPCAPIVVGIRGPRGNALLRRRGEYLERTFAHRYDTGGMPRTYLRGHSNILKRLLIQAGGFNLGLVMRHLIGVGTPRGLQGRLAALIATLLWLLGTPHRRWTVISVVDPFIAAMRARLTRPITALSSMATCTTG